ncbi:MAG TPA: hypothetical protein DEH78_00320 [Solibacterales bacterium]|nr:hypothetical protein [Bryobacterales bacterium]
MEPKELHQRVADLAGTAAKEVFETMLGIPVKVADHYLDHKDPRPQEGIVSLIGLVGSWIGTGSICCPSDTAWKLCSRMLMTEFNSVNEDVLDGMAELTNMIIGNVKTGLEEDMGPMGLSIPTVIFGRNFETRSVGNGEWTIIPLECEDGPVNILVCLAPNREGRTIQRFWMAGVRA